MQSTLRQLLVFEFLVRTEADARVIAVDPLAAPPIRLTSQNPIDVPPTANSCGVYIRMADAK